MKNEDLIDSIEMQKSPPAFISDKKPVVFTFENDS
jgi:hypothetical protein